MPLITLRDVRVRFRGPPLLDNVSCHIEAGQRIGLLGRNGAGKTTTLKSIMGAQVALPDAIWQRLTLAWVAFFVAMAALNLYVAYTYSLETWVDFKLFGTLGLTLVFVIGQALWIGRYAEDVK